MLKFSYYNFLIPVPTKNVYLIYNTLSNVLLEIDNDLASVLYKWRKMCRTEKAIPMVELNTIDENKITTLKDSGILVDSNINEKNAIHDRIIKDKEDKYDKGRFVLTISPTLSCNMGCPYCFEGEKPIKSYMSDKTKDDLIDFLEREINAKKIVNSFTSLGVTWFGGEPLLKPEIVEKLSIRLVDFTDKYDLRYSSACITNGLALTNEVWSLLERSKVTQVQVTIDGYKENHNNQRPILPMYGNNTVEENYERIIANLANVPDSIDVAIRVNVDKNVMDTIELFLDDLENIGIWPQKQSTFTIYLARKHPPAPRAGTSVTYDTSNFFSNREFVKAHEDFNYLLLDRYNRWAKNNSKKLAKSRFHIPRPVSSFLCQSASLPYSIVLDPEGYIHQCWEQPNDASTRSQHISEMYDIDHPLKTPFTDWDKFVEFDMCNNCKLLPVCDRTCAVIEPPDLCCEWRWSLKRRLRKQYIQSIDQPDTIQSMSAL